MKENSDTDTSSVAASVSIMHKNDFQTTVSTFCKILNISEVIPTASYAAFSGPQRISECIGFNI